MMQTSCWTDSWLTRCAQFALKPFVVHIDWQHKCHNKADVADKVRTHLLFCVICVAC